ncbi:hypothetical protein TNCT_545941, partial [Trichonephila clavata]
FQNKVVGEI